MSWYERFASLLIVFNALFIISSTTPQSCGKLDVVFLVDLSCGLPEYDCNVQIDAVAEYILNVKFMGYRPRIALLYFGAHPVDAYGIEIQFELDDFNYNQPGNINRTQLQSDIQNVGMNFCSQVVNVSSPTNLEDAINNWVIPEFVRVEVPVGDPDYPREKKIVIISNCVADSVSNVCSFAPMYVTGKKIDVVVINVGGISNPNSIENMDDLFTYLSCLVEGDPIIVVPNVTAVDFESSMDDYAEQMCLTNVTTTLQPTTTLEPTTTTVQSTTKEPTSTITATTTTTATTSTTATPSTEHNCDCNGGMVELTLEYTGQCESHITAYYDINKRLDEILPDCVFDNISSGDQLSCTAPINDGKFRNKLYFDIACVNDRRRLKNGHSKKNKKSSESSSNEQDRHCTAKFDTSCDINIIGEVSKWCKDLTVVSYISGDGAICDETVSNAHAVINDERTETNNQLKKSINQNDSATIINIFVIIISLITFVIIASYCIYLISQRKMKKNNNNDNIIQETHNNKTEFCKINTVVDVDENCSENHSQIR